MLCGYGRGVSLALGGFWTVFGLVGHDGEKVMTSSPISMIIVLKEVLNFGK